MKRINDYGFIILYGLFFLLILCKVINVPITHDEAATTVFYSNCRVWQIMFYIDIGDSPNNHILNTLLTKCCISLFGKGQWVVRLPNLLSFIVYAIAVFRIKKTVLKAGFIFFIPAALLFIANPYLLDFFGLCRGYGISCGLATLSVSFLISGYKFSRQQHIWLALILSVLASYANFTLLVFWCATSLLTWFYFFIQSNGHLKQIIKPTLWILFTSLLYVCLIANPVYIMQSTNQFQYWTSQGFYNDTILSLITLWLSEYHFVYTRAEHIISTLVLAIIAINCLYIFINFKKPGYKTEILRQPVFAATMIVLLTSLISIFQCMVLKTPNLTGRTALFFYPLFIVSLVSMFGLFSEVKSLMIQKIAALLISFFCIFHLATSFQLKYVMEWWFDANTLEVLDFFEKTNHNQTITLKTNWLFHPSFNFYCYTGKSPRLELFPIDHSIDTNTTAEYYYVFADDYKLLEPKFEVVQKFTDDRWLLKGNLEIKVIFRTIIKIKTGYCFIFRKKSLLEFNWFIKISEKHKAYITISGISPSTINLPAVDLII